MNAFAQETLPIKLRPSRLKWILVLLCSTAFVLAGIWVAPHERLIGYSCIAFFGLGLIVCLINLHPSSSYLVLSQDGFSFASLFRKHSVAWSQVESFRPINVALQRMVGWNYTSEYWKLQSLRKANVAISGAEAALPDTYGMSATASATLMEELRVKHANAR